MRRVCRGIVKDGEVRTEVILRDRTGVKNTKSKTPVTTIGRKRNIRDCSGGLSLKVKGVVLFDIEVGLHIVRVGIHTETVSFQRPQVADFRKEAKVANVIDTGVRMRTI